MRYHRWAVFPFWLGMILIGCGSDPDLNQVRQEILTLHQTGIAAHWNKDVDFFTRNIADEYFSVGNVEIRHPTKKEIRSQFTDYLNQTTFTTYEDLQEPIIGFSTDGSLAWSIVRVRVAGERVTETGVGRELDFICAWITLYRRDGEDWIRLGEVSSFQ